MYYSSADSFATFYFLFIIGMYLLQAFVFYKIGEKAGLSDNWIAFIPILQFIVFLHAIDKSAWNILLCLIPIVNVIIMIIWYAELFNAFGMSGAWVLTIFIGFVFVPLLVIAFSDNVQYIISNKYSL